MNEQYYRSSRCSNTTILPETSAAEPRLSAPSLVDTPSSTTFGPQGNTPYMENPSSYHCCVSRSYYTHSNLLYQQVPLPLTSNLPDLSKPTIRLICLKPGRDFEPLECTLFCVSLEVSVQFTALSYVWGDATIQYPITVNGCVIGITTSLYAALLQLRKPNSAIVLWADAICIDQKNLQERSCQVKEIPNIYGKAEEVIAWLGEADSNSSLAMDYIADHGGELCQLIRQPLVLLPTLIFARLAFLQFSFHSIFFRRSHSNTESTRPPSHSHPDHVPTINTNIKTAPNSVSAQLRLQKSPKFLPNTKESGQPLSSSISVLIMSIIVRPIDGPRTPNLEFRKPGFMTNFSDGPHHSGDRTGLSGFHRVL